MLIKTHFQGQLPKAILFDLDGTLVDSVPDLAYAVDQALLSVGLKAAGETEVRNWVGNGAKILVDRALKFALNNSSELAVDQSEYDALAQKAYQHFLNVYGNIPEDQKRSTLYPDVKTVLTTLKSQGCKLAIVTNKPAQFTPNILKTFEIDHFFDVVVCGDTCREQKPQAMPLLYAIEQLNVSVDKALMVGDSKNDIQAAKACPMRSVCVEWGYNHGDSVQDIGADHCVESLMQMLE